MVSKLTSQNVASRRGFLQQVGGGMLLTSLGVGLCEELGVASPTLGLRGPGEGTALDFGGHARLVDLITQTPVEKLQPRLMAELARGATCEELVAAGALANARAFGGEDYEGYHAFMALMPAFEISRSMTGKIAALPVLKVLYRNTARIQAKGAQTRPVLRSNPAAREAIASQAQAEEVIAKLRARDKSGAEAAFDALVRENPEASFEHLIPVVCHEVDVHRVVLAWRTWDLLRLTGQEHASTLMRQSVRQCVDREGDSTDDPIRWELPQVLEESRVFDAQPDSVAVDDKWVDNLARELCDSKRKDAATVMAHALREGVSTTDLGQALSLAATYLMLRQEGRTSSTNGRRVGSVHGAGTGVHSSDTAAAWRAMSRFGSERQRKLALIAGAYHVAGQSHNVARKPFAYGSVEVEAGGADALLGMLTECVSDQDQAGAAAAASHYVGHGHDLGPMLEMLLEESVAADGALHAEKYYRTQVEAIQGDRPAFRALHLAALARVCASQSYAQAAGREQALELVG